MKQLNNITTGQIAEVISSNETGIAVKIYHDQVKKNYDVISTQLTINKDFIPTEAKSINELNKELSFEILLTLEQFVGFAVSKDIQNWKFLDQEIRLFIPQTTIIEAMTKNNDFNTLIKKMEVRIRDLSVSSKEYVCLYWVNSGDIAPEDIAILMPYIQRGEIIMETKIVTEV